MLRNLDRLKNDRMKPDALAKVVEHVAQVADLMGSEDGLVTLSYETDDCEVGDLVPLIQIGVARVKKQQAVPLNNEGADA